MHKLRIGVLLGGKSREREVSFNSGRTLCDHLDSQRYQVVPIFQTVDNKLFILPWHFIHRGKITDFEHRLPTQAQQITWDSLKHYIDFAFIAMHGRYAEDGTMQGALEVLGIPYFGSSIFASALGMDKSLQKIVLQAHNIATPRSIDIRAHDVLDAQELNVRMSKANIQFPCMLKPAQEGSSFGVSIVNNQTELIDAIVATRALYPKKHQLLLLEEKLTGMEFTCSIITDYHSNKLIALPPTEVIIEENSLFYDYQQKYMPGRATKRTPAHCSKEITQRIQDTCIQVMQALCITNIARIDGFVTSDNNIVIIDPNSFAGMAPSSFFFKQAAEIGMNHRDIINHLLETELHSYGMLEAIEIQEKHTMTSKKQKIAVLLGGASNEKEISLESGRNIVYKLSPQKYDVLALFVNNNQELFTLDQRLLVCNSTKEISDQLTPDCAIQWHDLPTLVDFVFIGLHGGSGENGGVQGMLEMLGLPYNGSGVFASSLCMDKYQTGQFLSAQGFDVPSSMLLSLDDWQIHADKLCTTIEETFGLPCIVKPHDDGCSVMVACVKNKQELKAAINAIFASKQHVLVEEFIQGMELTVAVIGNENPRALPPSEAIANAGILSIEEKFLPGAGENQTPARLSQVAITFVQRTLEKAYIALQCKGYVRIDCFYQNSDQSATGKERLIILEINTLPGMTPATCIFHQAAEVGMKPSEFIDIIVQLGFEEHAPHISVNLKKDYTKGLGVK